MWEPILIIVGLYLACGVCVLMIAREKLTTDKWYGWIVIVIAWPGIIIPLLRGY